MSSYPSHTGSTWYQCPKCGVLVQSGEVHECEVEPGPGHVINIPFNGTSVVFADPKAEMLERIANAVERIAIALEKGGE